jgi:hypothetical protein
MTTVHDVCRHLRSKNAGPFWVTVDLFFNSQDNFEKYHDCSALGPELFQRLYGTNPALVRRYSIPSLLTVKISYPRVSPLGGVVERDMHSGQQYVRLLDVKLD